MWDNSAETALEFLLGPFVTSVDLTLRDNWKTVRGI